MPFDKNPRGDFSRVNIAAMEYAETLQAMALDSIREQFGVRRKGLDVMEGFTYQQYMDAITEAELGGKRDEFEADLAQQFAEMQQMAAQQAAAAQEQPQ
jgi:hypothetical protein